MPVVSVNPLEMKFESNLEFPILNILLCITLVLINPEKFQTPVIDLHSQ